MVEKQATMTPEFLHEALALAQVVCWEWDLLRNSLQIPVMQRCYQPGNSCWSWFTRRTAAGHGAVSGH
jgi:hypothetical protein